MWAGGCEIDFVNWARTHRRALPTRIEGTANPTRPDLTVRTALVECWRCATADGARSSEGSCNSVPAGKRPRSSGAWRTCRKSQVGNVRAECQPWQLLARARFREHREIKSNGRAHFCKLA